MWHVYTKMYMFVYLQTSDVYVRMSDLYVYTRDVCVVCGHDVSVCNVCTLTMYVSLRSCIVCTLASFV